MSAANRLRTTTEFSLETMVRAYEHLYVELMRPRW